jgi:hypothetical protein
MSIVRYDQSNFTGGELDPRAYARTDTQAYYSCAKNLQNCIVVPQGGVKRRFGTRYVDSLAVAQNASQAKLGTMIIEDAEYLIIFEQTSIKIYLENILSATVVNTYQKEDIASLQFCQVVNKMFVFNPNFSPMQLTRSFFDNTAITGIDAINNYLNLDLTNKLAPGSISAVRFLTNGVMPTTNPQIYPNRTYYIKAVNNNACRIYASSSDALNDINYFQITALGNTNFASILNSWTFTNIVFKNMPSFSFINNYDNTTFQPSFTTGTITLTCSANIFNQSFVGGIFTGNEGVGRITNVISGNQITLTVIKDFKDTTPIPGRLAYLGEPVWSVARGFPKTGTLHQNRLFLGGTTGLPNGVWGSVTNDVYDFDDSESLDDNAISWYPSSGDFSQINFLNSGKSLFVHTAEGFLTTSGFTESVLTPKTFFLSEQNKDGISNVEPAFLDNQTFYIDRSLKNVKAVAWDFNISGWALKNVSLISNHLIKSPVDMCDFNNNPTNDGNFIFVCNGDGTLASFQVIEDENIRAWTPGKTDGAFCQVVSTGNRVWFLVQRTINGNAVLMIEELDFSLNTDCSFVKTNINSDTINGLGVLEGKQLSVLADGFYQGVFTVQGGQIVLPSVVQNANVGLSFTSILQPLPIGNIMGTPSNLYAPKHIRSFYINYYKMLGATIEGNPIPTAKMGDIVLDQPLNLSSGIYQYSPFKGWNIEDFNLTIQQNIPLPMTIIGISYVIDI